MLSKIIKSTWAIILNGYKSLVASDPCKTCIVSICCTIRCEKKCQFEKLLFPEKTLKDKKYYVIIVTSLILISFLPIILMFIVLDT